MGISSCEKGVKNGKSISLKVNINFLKLNISFVTSVNKGSICDK